MRVKVIIVLAVALAAATAGLVVLATRDPKPDPGVIEYRNDAVPNSETRLLRAERIGRQIWGNVCHGDITITVGPLEGGMVAQASWWAPNGSTDPDTFYDCAIVVSDKRRFPWVTLCQVVAGHEMGHLAGREHVANPRSVMYFKGTKHNVPPRCRT